MDADAPASWSALLFMVESLEMKMQIELLGDNCKMCSMQKTNIGLAIKRCKFLAEFSQVHDPAIFASYGILSLPGIVINGELRSEGRLLSVEEIVSMMTETS